MRALIAALVLIFSFQSWTKADDIRDFQIEGISIGDSLLDFFTKNEIKKSPKSKQYKDKKYVTATFYDLNSEYYDAINISFKKKDKQYIIQGVSGSKDYNNNIDECYKKQNEVFNELKTLFKNAVNTENKLRKIQWSQTATTNQSYMKFKDGSFAGVQCFKYGKDDKKKYNIKDLMRVSLFTKEYNYWLVNIAFK